MAGEGYRGACVRASCKDLVSINLCVLCNDLGVRSDDYVCGHGSVLKFRTFSQTVLNRLFHPESLVSETHALSRVFYLSKEVTPK